MFSNTFNVLSLLISVVLLFSQISTASSGTHKLQLYIGHDCKGSSRKWIPNRSSAPAEWKYKNVLITFNEFIPSDRSRDRAKITYFNSLALTNSEEEVDSIYYPGSTVHSDGNIVALTDNRMFYTRYSASGPETIIDFVLETRNQEQIDKIKAEIQRSGARIL